MPPKEFTGTWEEVAQHAPEFAGRQVRLIVLPEESATALATKTQEEYNALAAQIFAEVDAAERIPIPPSADPMKRKVEEAIEERARKAGLVLS